MNPMQSPNTGVGRDLQAVVKEPGFGIRLPTSGGKAGRGLAKTSTVQVMCGNMLVRQFRFTVASEKSKQAAMAKAYAFIESNQ